MVVCIYHPAIREANAEDHKVNLPMELSKTLSQNEKVQRYVASSSVLAWHAQSSEFALGMKNKEPAKNKSCILKYSIQLYNAYDFNQILPGSLSAPTLGCK